MVRRLPLPTIAILVALVAAACTGTSASPPQPGPEAGASDPGPTTTPASPPEDTRPTGRPGQLRAVADPATPRRAQNIIVILTDDQRWDTLWAMPRVQEDVIGAGVTFENAYASNPLCCPSRASILTGLYSQHTGVYTNNRKHGSVFAFDPTPTIATMLQRRDWRTALIGKYLNGYGGREVPPGWDRWFAFAGETGGAEFLNYVVNDDGRLRTFGRDRARDYSLDILTRQALREIRATRKRLFMYLALPAPHLPATPPRRYSTGFLGGLQPNRPPNFNEEDVSDKPRWVQRIDPFRLREGDSVPRLEKAQRLQLRSLLAVDETVGRVVDELERAGELDETMLIFASDNGLMWGEHRMTSKYAAYEESLRIPLAIRFDPLTGGMPAREPRLAVNVDLAPTIAAAAGLRILGADGRSLTPLLANEAVRWRSDFLIEHLKGPTQRPPTPTYCGNHGTRWVHVAYVGGSEELYDLARDPYQLDNLVAVPRYRDVLRRMRGRTAHLCRPAPPGMTIPPAWG